MQGKISPAFPNENVPVVFSANDAFCPYMAIMIESVIENRRVEKNYDIMILHSDILESTQKQIKSLVNDTDNVIIRFIDVTPYFSNVNLFVDIKDKRLTKETYYRLIVGEILDDTYEKVIYLDGDMVTLVDVSSLMDLELTNAYLAAPYDVTGISYCHKEGNDRIDYRTKVIEMNNPDDYFIAGLLVFNLQKIRKDFPGKALVELAASRDWLQHDQDVLNYICKNGKALLLHPAWNVLQDSGNNRYLPSPLKEMWLESERNPKIIHYGGSRKPWKKNVVRQEYFWKYAAKTNFFPTIVREMLRQEQRYPETMWEQLEQDIAFVQKEIMLNHIQPTRESIFAALAKLAGERSVVLPEKPLISVIVPIYNAEAFLNKCIESIINQTYENLEIILVDDGSTDASGKICDAFAVRDSRVRVIHKENGGVATARNRGLQEVNGDLIGWVDADDWIACDMYEYLVDGIKKYHTPVAVCGYINSENDVFTARIRNGNEVLSAKDALDNLFHYHIRTYLCDKLWVKSLFEGISFEEGAVFEDTKVTYRLFEKARWIVTLKYGKYYRVHHEGSIVKVPSVKNKIQACQALIYRYDETKERWPELTGIQLIENFNAVLRLRDTIKNTSEREFKENFNEVREVVSHLNENKELYLSALSEQKKSEFLRILGGKRNDFIESFSVPMEKKANHSDIVKPSKSRFLLIKEFPKRVANNIFPAYRVSRRVEKKLGQLSDWVRKLDNHINDNAGDKSLNKSIDTLKQASNCNLNISNNETIYWLQQNQPGETMEDTKKRVFMSMPKWGGDVSILQKGNLYLLRRLRKICKDNSIPFWLIGGTLLGAIRHKGYIPWDDDIDVGIMRADLEKLKEIISSQYSDISLKRYYYAPGPWQTFKLILTEETSPFWIDLLVYDFAGDRTTAPDDLWKKIQAVRNNCINNLRKQRNTLFLDYRDEYVYDQADAEIIDKKYNGAIAALPTVFFRDYIYRSVDNVSGEWQRLFPCSRIFPFAELEFEGDLYSVPKDYEWYLKLQYGDYYSIPSDVGHVHTRFVGDKLGDKEAIQKLFEKMDC